MIPIGLKQKPLLEYAVRLFKFNGISDVVFLVSYKAEQIINYFGDGSRFDINISYVRDASNLKGTGGSVFNAYKRKSVSTDDVLLVYYGDILTTVNLRELLDYHKKKLAMATVALSSGFTVRVGLADFDKDGKIHGFVEKPKLEKPVSIGILALNGETLKVMEQLHTKMHELDLMRDLIPNLIGNKKSVYGYLTEAFWYDVGSVEAYEKLNNQFIEKSFAHLFK
jgi:mannose-1-phosphate guanylyltransferase